MVKDALLEIGCEELPAKFVRLGRQKLEENVPKIMAGYDLAFSKLEVWATPRRLAVYLSGLAEKQKDLIKEIIGPKVSAAFDDRGNPTAAALGFARSQGIKVDQLKKKETSRGEVVVIEQKQKGQLTEKLLTYIFPKIVLSLNFPKTMSWEQQQFLFPRPIRSLLGLYGQKKIQFSLADVKSSNYTFGLFPLFNKKIVIPSPARYLSILKNNYVIADVEERKQVLKKGMQQAVKKIGGKVLEDEELLSEVVNILEYPTPVLGKFDEAFLKLPSEVIVICLKKKQKYFSVVDTAGKLMPYFIGIRNGSSEYQDVVRSGYERVLTARLDDARFFFKRDCRYPLTEWAEKLKGMIFQEQLGTVYDKIQRLSALSEYIFNQVMLVVGNGRDRSTSSSSEETTLLSSIKRTALLCKADLLTEMVGEFPELQGTIGRIYAQLNGEKEAVSHGIEEHLWPNGADGRCPNTLEGIVVSLADKIDTLAGDFAIGLVPSGSADPYGLRRLAAGMVKIILEKSIKLPINELIDQALALLPLSLPETAKEKTKNNLLNFFIQRIETIFQEEGFAYDEIRAVLAVGFSDLAQTKLRLVELHALRTHPDFEPISAAFKRTVNILRQAREKKLLEGITFQSEKLLQDEEKELHRHLERIFAVVPDLLARKDFKSALQQLVSLRAPVDKFFDKVMVLAEDESLRSNRLALLEKISQLFFQFADFSQIVVKEEK
ncbi:MAG: glycine--tRNA ligase subunit beta [Elusimicrobiota bacterium]